MKKRVSPGAGRAIILIHARSISRLETAFGRCDLVQLASSVRGRGGGDLEQLATCSATHQRGGVRTELTLRCALIIRTPRRLAPCLSVGGQPEESRVPGRSSRLNLGLANRVRIGSGGRQGIRCRKGADGNSKACGQRNTRIECIQSGPRRELGCSWTRVSTAGHPFGEIA